MKKNKLNNIKATGFKTPENYFESFEAKLLDRIVDKQKLEGLSKTGFTVPNEYFKTVEDSILDKINTRDNTPVISLTSRKSFYYIASIAASLMLLFAIYINTNNKEELSIEMVENYFEDTEISSYELAQLMSETDFLEDNFTIIESTFNEDNLETYLLENSDIESFIE